jgi:acyl-CoA synthetase (NDP forming)
MDLNPLFRPQTMAVVGISQSNDRHPANVIFRKNKLRHSVEVFAVSEKGGEFRGETIYGRVSEIPKRIDLVVIVTRAETVPEILKDCIRAQAGGAVIVSGGFAESGRQDLQETLVSIAREANFPFIGPNCLGIFAPPWVDTLFIPSERIVRPQPGKVALVSQSGGILVDHLIKFTAEGVGLSLAVSIGNKAVLNELHLLSHFLQDPGTDVVAFYLEGLAAQESREFLQTAKSSPKPIVVLKAGKSAGGMRAVTSHTGSLAGDYRIFSSILAQYGLVEAGDESELISYCEALSCYPRSIEGRVGIITASGGHGALAVDACAAQGLAVPSFSGTIQQELRSRVAENLRAIASFANPVDLTGSAMDSDFVQTAQFLGDLPEVDCILLLLLPYLPGISSDLAGRLSLMALRGKKPMIAYVPHVEKYGMLIEGFQLNRIPVAPSIQEAVQMVKALRKYRRL